MAVQAQYPSTVLLFNRNEQERDNDAEEQPVFFSEGSSRKRPREATAVPSQFQQYLYVNANASLLHEQTPNNSMVSTGLCLSAEKQSQSNAPTTAFAAEISQQIDDIDRFIYAQGEQLRRTLAEGRRRHLRLVAAAAARWMEVKGAELELALKRGADLEQRLARLLGESAAWQAKAKAEETAAAELQGHLRQAAAAAAEEHAGSRDKESCCADPRHQAESPPACRICAEAEATVLLLPCRHLCICRGCAAAAEACPVCSCVRSAAVEVYPS